MRVLAWLVSLACLVAVCLSGAALSQAPQEKAAEIAPAVATPAVPRSLDLPGRVRATLGTHCARCHERDKLMAPLAAASFDYVTQLERVGKDPALVQPGQPDNSRLYAVLLAKHAPVEAFGPERKDAPTPDEINDVRQWISGLEQPAMRPAVCPERKKVTPAGAAQVLAVLARTGGDSVKGIRFISLASDSNRCVAADDLERRIATVRGLLERLRTASGEMDLPFAADGVPILAVRLTDLGWDASEWDALAALSGAAQLRDDALANAYATATPLIGAVDLAEAARRSGSYPRLSEVDEAVGDLLREAQVPVTASQAAADLGLAPDALSGLLEGVQGDAAAAAWRMRQGPLPLPAWRQLRAALSADTTGLSYALPIAAPELAPPLDVGLWTEKASYHRGELLVLTATANRDCHLTVINIDPRGEATVLFPSDSDPDNAVKAGTRVRIPGELEPYQLRVNEAGTESFVAVCNTARKRLEGVPQDFEQQRFSGLGNWQEFLKTTAAREADIVRNATPRRRRARRAKAPPAVPAPSVPEHEARSAIYVKVE